MIFLWRRFYDLLIWLAVPVVLLRLAGRGLRAPAYWRRWPERFALWRRPPRAATIWIHAVSVGEAQAALPVINTLLERRPDASILVTTTTPTGSARVRDALGNRVQHVYLPYDLPGAVARFFNRVRPRVGVIMETELWPNLFRAAHRRGIPLIVVNARLSERSARGYGRVHTLTRSVLRDVHLIAAQSEADAERFRELGAEPDRVTITGSIKFDMRISAQAREAGRAIREAAGSSRSVWTVGSTHEGEDEQVLEAFRRVRERHPDCMLILVPRHPERFRRVGEQCRRAGFRVATRSAEGVPDTQTEIFLGDTIGELVAFYAAADVAFVGGSLVATGGHNPLEPAALGVPVVFGPHMFNFAEVSRLLLGAEGAWQVHNAGELASRISDLLADASLRAESGARAAEVVDRNRGALDRILALVEGLL